MLSTGSTWQTNKKRPRDGERDRVCSRRSLRNLNLLKEMITQYNGIFLMFWPLALFYFKFCLKFLLFTRSPLSCRVESPLPEYRRVLSSALLHVYNRIAGFTSIAVNVAINKFLRKQNVFTWWAPVTQYRERGGRGAADEIVLPETHCRTLASVVKPRLGQYTLCCCCCFSFQGRNRKYIPE